MSKEQLLELLEDLEEKLELAQVPLTIFDFVLVEAVRVEAEKIRDQLQAIDTTKLQAVVDKLNT